MTDREFIGLCTALAENEISAGKLADLEAHLLGDARARAEFLRFMQVRATLESFPPILDEDTEGAPLASSRSIIRMPRLRALARLAVAAALAVAVTLGLQSLFRNNSLEIPNTPAGAHPVATLLFAGDCKWAPVSKNLAEGQRLAPGPVWLKSGDAVIRFDGGAELVLSGDTKIELQSAGRGDLIHGEVVVRAEDGAEGFTLHTPARDVIDLGTEFAVKVERSGATEVHVHDGEVEFRTNRQEAAAIETLKAGGAVRFDQAKSSPRNVALDAPRFQERVLRANPRPRMDLMRVYDGFHYQAGVLPLQKSTAGKGWKGPWRLRLASERRLPEEETTPDALQIVHGRMNVTWPVPGGRLGMLELPPGNAFYVRELEKPIAMDKPSVLFFSLIVRESERTGKTGRPRDAFRLTFRSSEDYFGEALSFGYGPNFRPRIQSGPGIAFTSPQPTSGEQTTLWIGKIVIRPESEDEIYFRVYDENEPLDYAEPAEWHVATRGVELDSRFDRILISSTGLHPRIVDELRIGPIWRSVAPFIPGSSPDR